MSATSDVYVKKRRKNYFNFFSRGMPLCYPRLCVGIIYIGLDNGRVRIRE